MGQHLRLSGHSCRTAQADSQRKSARLSDVLRSVDCHILKKPRKGCEPLSKQHALVRQAAGWRQWQRCRSLAW